MKVLMFILCTALSLNSAHATDLITCTINDKSKVNNKTIFEIIEMKYTGTGGLAEWGLTLTFKKSGTFINKTMGQVRSVGKLNPSNINGSHGYIGHYYEAKLDNGMCYSYRHKGVLFTSKTATYKICDNNQPEASVYYSCK